MLQLANALYPLIEEAAPLETILNKYKTDFESGSLNMMRSKIGLYCEEETDVKIVQALEDVLHLTETDMTIFFRNLSSFKTENPTEGLNLINEAFYKPNEIVGNIEKRWNDWFNSYAKRLQSETLSNTERRKKMNAVNPKYVLRNYMAQLAIDAADKGDYKLISELFNMLKKPYDAQPEYDKWFAKRPDWARHKVGCSMLSCSS